LIGAGVVGLLIFLAAVMPKVFAFRRSSGSARPVLPDNPLLTDYLLIALVVLFVAAAIVIRLVVQKGASSGPPKRRPVWAQLLTFLIILFSVGTVSSLLEEQGILEQPDPSASLEPQEIAGGDEERSRPLGFLLSGVLVLMVGGLIALIVMVGRKDKGRGSARPLDEILAEELDVGLAELDLTEAPRDAVIACYVRMERALIEAGIPRRRSDTPFEFIERALGSAAVPQESARRLTTLFERARFSPHPTSPEMKDEAMATLEDVRSHLKGVRWPA
jgi:hypothetical protein